MYDMKNARTSKEGRAVIWWGKDPYSRCAGAGSLRWYDKSRPAWTVLPEAPYAARSRNRNRCAGEFQWHFQVPAEISRGLRAGLSVGFSFASPEQAYPRTNCSIMF